MNELSTTAKQLPDNLEDLAKFVLIGRAQLKSVREHIKNIDKIGLAKEVHEQKLQEAQEIAEAVLDAEAKIGELTSKMKTSQGQRTDIEHIRNGADKSKKAQLQTIGISQDTAERFETLARHPETVEKAKADARAEGRIVTRQDVLNRIAEPTKSKHQFMKDFKQQVRDEHKSFEESDDKVVSIADIQRDKKNTEIIALDVSTAITRALSGVGNLGMIKKDEFALMTNSLKPQAKADMINRARESINILSNLINMLGGKE
ncbi:MAG: hypothetical protein IIY21_24120 [Clostridiales bacterium]|nr:hypothetical protein [Clostridiales bacterium]